MAFRGESTTGWVAVDDFIFLPDIEDCTVKPPGANPHSTTAGPDQTTHYPPSMISYTGYQIVITHFQPLPVILRLTFVDLR